MITDRAKITIIHFCRVLKMVSGEPIKATPEKCTHTFIGLVLYSHVKVLDLRLINLNSLSTVMLF